MDSETKETQNKTIESKSNVILVNGASQEIEDIDWLWKGWLAKGKFHLLAGAPGTGKTMLALNMAAIITKGGKWPDKSSVPLGRVLIWSGEDHINDTLLPRLVAAGADVNLIEFIDKVNEFNRKRSFDFKTDIPQLSQKIEEINGCSLLIIDSIVQAVAGDSNKNSNVRNALNPLVELGIYYNCAILGITHVNKRSTKHAPLDRVTGSLAFGAVARIILMTDKIQSEDEGSSSDAVLVRAKTNIGECDGGFEYGIQEVEFEYKGKIHSNSTIRWQDEPLKGTARNILKFADNEKFGGGSGIKYKAVQLLKTELADKPRPSSDIKDKAREQGIPERALDSAKKLLDIQSYKQDGVNHGQWMNSLPENESMQVDMPIQIDQKIKNNELYKLTDEERERIKERCIKNYTDNGGDNVTYISKLINEDEIQIYFEYIDNEMLAETIERANLRRMDGVVLKESVINYAKNELKNRVDKEKHIHLHADDSSIIGRYKKFFKYDTNENSSFKKAVLESVLIDRKIDTLLILKN